MIFGYEPVPVPVQEQSLLAVKKKGPQLVDGLEDNSCTIEREQQGMASTKDITGPLR